MEVDHQEVEEVQSNMVEACSWLVLQDCKVQNVLALVVEAVLSVVVVQHEVALVVLHWLEGVVVLKEEDKM